MVVRVKICGITNLEDARTAVEAGADALGFIFFQGSARYISPGKAGEIVRTLPPFVTPVGVFVDSAASEIERIARESGVRVAQLHGNETPEFCQTVPMPVVKAVRVKDPSSLAGLREYEVAGLLLDSYVPGQLGGTGETFNWDLVREVKESGRPIIVAGGLNAKNVGDAVMQAQPYGVDVSSGVEFSPGRKDPEKVRAFVAAARWAGEAEGI